MNFKISIIYGIILPIDELIFFKIVKTTDQISYAYIDNSRVISSNYYGGSGEPTIIDYDCGEV